MKNYRSKAPMPLFYLQIENGAEAHKIYDFTELFGTRIEPPTTSTALPTPAPRKDASVNAGLLKDLLVIIEDTPCIDKQIFCRAFKNSPFPRSARHLRTWINRIISSKLTASFAPPGLIFPAHVKKSLKIGFWNANSLRNKIHEVREFVNEQNFDLFLVRKPGLSQVLTPRSQTIVYSKTIGLNSPYRNARRHGHLFNCIIAGDFNASHVDWHNVKNTRYGISLRNLVSNLRGAKLVAPQTATHLQPRQRFGSVIDLAVFKHIPYNHSVRVLSDLSSDHYPVILEINLNTSLIKNPEQLSTNWSNFKFVLSKKPLPSTDLTSNENIELAISELNQNFSEAFVEASKPKFKNAPKSSPRD
ncbi:RNA-directed DNA polymerase from mobile element jockey [Trichonephila clavipes]|nr:RNA-directed DNA polymerase from mobile element jockey [Trichonephila clavipes]